VKSFGETTLRWMMEKKTSTWLSQDAWTGVWTRTVRDYRTHLIQGRKAKPASVNLTLAALDSFYRWIGLGPARVRRDDLPKPPPAPSASSRPAGSCEPPNAPRRQEPPVAHETGQSSRCCCSPACGSGNSPH